MTKDKEDKEDNLEIDKFEEDDEEITELEDEEIILNDTSEIDRILLSRFMSQTGRGVSLSQIDIAPTLSLEKGLGQQELNSLNGNEGGIEYITYQKAEEKNYFGGPEVGALSFRKDLGKPISVADRILEEQKAFSKKGFDLGGGSKNDDEMYSPLERRELKGEYQGLKELN